MDKTQHEIYHLKMQFLGSKFYVECNEIEMEMRIAIKFYEDEECAKAEKLLDEFIFLFIKN
jgi:hypothetical protein